MGVDEFWADFCAATGHVGEYYEAVAFGDEPAMQNELCDLVLRGIKRATASAAFWYGEDRAKAPKPGDLSIMLDGAGIPRGVFETVAIFEAPFHAVDAQFAADEGEGDGSLAYWRREHERYFTRLLAKEGLEFSEAVWKLLRHGLEGDSRYGCGHQKAVGGWPGSRRRRSVIQVI